VQQGVAAVAAAASTAGAAAAAAAAAACYAAPCSFPPLLYIDAGTLCVLVTLCCHKSLSYIKQEISHVLLLLLWCDVLLLLLPGLP
jgi:hypothetical protein